MSDINTNRDIITKFVLENSVLVTAADTTGVAARAKELHHTFPTCTAALGRTLTAALLMASGLKSEQDDLTISLNGGGPAGTVLATAGADCAVRGYIGDPCVDIPARKDGKLDVGGAIGKNGFLTVVKDIGMKEPYTGRTPLVSGEVAEDLAWYYLKSEQQPSVVYLSVWVDIDTEVLKAGGVTITPLPGAPEEVISAIEARLPQIENYALMIMQLTPEEAIRKIFLGMELKKLSDTKPAYRCNCSRERLAGVLASLGREEIEKILKEDGQAEIVCRFCNTKYMFGAEDLREILAASKDQTGGETL